MALKTAIPATSTASGFLWYDFSRLLRFLKFAVCVLFLVGLAYVCYRRPVPDDFDRYIYEAIVRGKSQPLEVVYDTVKHENPRAEESSVLDSPQHLRELEPLYAIRPLTSKPFPCWAPAFRYRTQLISSRLRRCSGSESLWCAGRENLF